MSNIPVLKPQQVVRILENLGFREVRQKGSHKTVETFYFFGDRNIPKLLKFRMN